MPRVDWIARRTEGQLRMAALPVIPYAVEDHYPHDAAAFTQGLCYHRGYLLESTGWWGRSSVRMVSIEDGQVISSFDLPPHCFGEGLVRWNDEIIAVTWQDETGFRLDLRTFQEKGRFTYEGEAWGLTHNQTELIVSDGSSTLRFLDPLTFIASRSLRVTAGGLPVHRLNDLVWVAGEIWANIWQTDLIARIDGTTGKVSAWLDLSALRLSMRVTGADEVLNGVAYSETERCFFVTGKMWPRLFKIRLLT